MSALDRFRHGVQIARTAWRCDVRRADRSVRAAVVVLAALAVASALGAYATADALYRGVAALPLDAMRVGATASTLALAWPASRYAADATERLHADLVLTTVSAREAALGVSLFACSRLAAPASLPVSGFAAGFALGARTPGSFLAVAAAAAAVLALGGLLGAAASFASDLAAARSPRFRRYNAVFRVAAWVLVFVAWAAVVRGPVSTVALAGWLRAAPVAWVADLALAGTPGVAADPVRVAGTLAAVGVCIAVLTAGVVRLGERALDAERVRDDPTNAAESLARDGLAERLLADRVSRPALTVARKRWLQERRVPRAVLAVGYLFLLAPAVYLPALAAGTVPGVSLVAFACVCAIGAGLAFGAELLGVEYPAMEATLTSVPGRQFVRGGVLSGVAVGAPVVVAGTLALGAASPVHPVETVLVAVAGVALCACSVTVGVAASVRVPYREFQVLPVPFTDVTVHGVAGLRGFLNLSAVVAVVAVVCSPAVLTYLATFAAGGAASPDAAPATVRAASLLATTVIAGTVTSSAYRRAVRWFDAYRLA